MKPRKYESFDSLRYVGNGGEWEVFVNGNEEYRSNPEVEIGSFGSPGGDYDQLLYCPFCKKEVLDLVTDYDTDYEDPHTKLKWCRNCHFWASVTCRYLENTDGETGFHHWTWSKMRTFDRDLPEPCADEFACYLKRHPDLFSRVDPLYFERVVADIWNSNYAESEVIHVGKSHDQGVDVIYVDSDGHDWLIQVKKHINNEKGESFSTVRDLAGTLLLKGAVRGVVVSTSNHFSKPAVCAKNKYRKRGYEIDLVDQGKLRRMLSEIEPTYPWKKHILQDNPEHFELLEKHIKYYDIMRSRV